MKRDTTLIDKLFHDKDPLEGLNRVLSYYDRYYEDEAIIIGMRIAREIIQFH